MSSVFLKKTKKIFCEFFRKQIIDKEKNRQGKSSSLPVQVIQKFKSIILSGISDTRFVQP